MRAPLAAAAAALLAGSCQKLVPVELSVVEPCGQENQALNGVQSFRMLSTGADQNGDEDNVVAFKATEPLGMSIGLGERVVITVEGFTDDITVQPDPTRTTSTPRAVGRTVPLLIEEGTAAVRGTVLAGRVDSFGSPRDVDGNCSKMNSGGSVAGRHGHTATYIPALNKVLIFGGAVWASPDGNSPPVETFLKSAEVYDPVTGTFSKLPDARNARAYHTATALPDGRVIIWGGLSTLNGVTSAIRTGEIIDVRNLDAPYGADPILGRISRAHHTATLLEDVGGGLLVIVGGCSGGVAEGCAPNAATGTSTALVPSIELLDISGDLASTRSAAGSLTTPRAMHQAVAFPSGNTSVIGVVGGLNSTGALDTIEVLQVNGGDDISIVAGDSIGHAVVRHQATVFNPAELRFFVSGGQDQAPDGVLSDTAPGLNTVTNCTLADAQVSCVDLPAPLQSPRYGHAMVQLLDSTLVVIGGVVPNGSATAEVLRQQAGTGSLAWSATAGALTLPRLNASVALLGGASKATGFVNQVFYSGGYSFDVGGQPVTSDRTDIYFGR